MYLCNIKTKEDVKELKEYIKSIDKNKNNKEFEKFMIVRDQLIHVIAKELYKEWPRFKEVNESNVFVLDEMSEQIMEEPFGSATAQSPNGLYYGFHLDMILEN